MNVCYARLCQLDREGTLRVHCPLFGGAQGTSGIAGNFLHSDLDLLAHHCPQFSPYTVAGQAGSALHVWPQGALTEMRLGVLSQ